MTKYIYWLDELDKNSIPQAGGKGANLGEMYSAKFPVPNAFVVSADIYWDFINETKVKDHIESLLEGININDTAKLDDITGQIRKLILNAKVPAEIAKSIKEAYKKLDKEEVFTAVRSSATAEDLPDASFAGQQDTYLNVKGGKEIVEAVKKCWASLFTARSTFYREKNNYPHMQVKIAVIVQKMVDSERAGVAFTRDPVSGEEKMVIEAGWGLGDFVVSGKINPDNYTVDANSLEILNKRLGNQEIMNTKDPVTGESITTDVPSNKRNIQIIGDNEIVVLAEILKKVHEHYKSPQDIEWAYDNGKFYVVQSRPVTTIGKKLDEEDKEEIVNSGDAIVEGLPASPGHVSGIVHIINDLEKGLSMFKEGEILVTKMTDPDYVPLMQKAKAIVTDEGGTTAHAAIVSRELGVPCVVGTQNATSVLKNGQTITVDATNGKIYEGRLAEETLDIEPETVSLSTPIVTGTKIYMNLGIPDKAEEYSKLGADGIGLMREEFIIASQLKEHPLLMIEKGEEQKFVDILVDGISKTCKAFSPRPVVLRFSDFKSNEYKGMKGGEKYEPDEENPMIGWRGCSRYISSKFEKAFRLECRAIKKVRETNKNLWVMLPFVRTIEELKKVKKIMLEEGLDHEPDFKIWLMAEVPSNIFLADEFSKYCDGFSIGSNDLTQLVLGVDRDSAILAGTKMYIETNEAVKRAISLLISVAHENGKTVSICGQAPSVYPEFVEFLVRNGIDSISVNPDAVNSVRQNVAGIERKILLEKGLETETQEEGNLIENTFENNYEYEEEVKEETEIEEEPENEIETDEEEIVEEVEPENEIEVVEETEIEEEPIEEENQDKYLNPFESKFPDPPEMDESEDAYDFFEFES